MTTVRTLICLVALLLLIAAPARAGTYRIESCRDFATLDSIPSPRLEGWSEYADGLPRSALDNCNPANTSQTRHFGALIAVGTHPPGVSGGWVFKPPPDTVVDSVELRRLATAYLTPGYGGAGYRLYADAPRGAGARLLEECMPENQCTEIGRWVDPFAPESQFSATNLAASAIYAVIECAQTNCNQQTNADHWPDLVIYAARIGLADSFSPELVGEPSGSLVAPRVAGEASVTFSATDRGGGLARAVLVVDGVDVAVKDLFGAGGYCQEPYVRIVPCPLSATPTVSFDTAAIGNGVHQLQLAVVDAGGNRALSKPWTAEVRNGSLPNGANATPLAKLVVRVRNPHTVAYGTRSTIEGRLTTPEGVPIGGARLSVTSRLQRQAEQARGLGAVTIGADGRFVYDAGSGASRVYRFGYRAQTLDDAEATAAEAAVAVKARVSLTVSPGRARNGTRIRFSGRLLGGPGQEGTLVTIYALQRTGRKRIPVDTVKADASGRFALRYRFRSIGGNVTFRFQARVVHQPNYPYAAGASSVVAVRARP